MEVTNLGLIFYFMVKITNYLILEIKYYLYTPLNTSYLKP